MNKEEIKTPDILLTALRQYQHNDCSGLLAGFDYEETIKIVLHLLSNPQQSQWISVDDRLPCDNETVRWWLVGKTEEEAWKDSDGKPICPNQVFPAPAGMNRNHDVYRVFVKRVPRACGDEPITRM